MGKKHREGFTLIELLVAMMVLAIALGIGWPAFNDFMANQRMAGAANDLVTALHAARSEALTRARPVTLCASSTWAADEPSCDPAASLLEGWIVVEDVNANVAVDEGDDVLYAHEPLDTSIRSQAQSGADQGPPQYVTYRADGLLQNVVGLPPAIRNVQLCDPRGDRETTGGKAAGRLIQLSPGGRPTSYDEISIVQDPNRNPLGGCPEPE